MKEKCMNAKGNNIVVKTCHVHTYLTMLKGYTRDCDKAQATA